MMPTVMNEKIMKLTNREIEVLDRLTAGKRRKQIAEDLGISEHTLKFHCNGILRKLDVDTMLMAAVTYVRGTNAGVG